MLTGLALLLLGVVALWAGAEGLVRGASRLGTRYRVSPVLVGVTIVSLGTSLPELVVCLLAAGRGSPDLVLGNVLGSNMANVGLVLGVTALVRPVRVAEALRRRDLPAVLGVTLVVLPLLLGGVVGRLDGVLLLAIFTGYMVLLVRSARKRRTHGGGEDPLAAETTDVPTSGHPPEARGGREAAGTPEATSGPRARRRGPPAGRAFLLAGAGSLLLVGGGHGIVEGALILAAELGISEVLVGLSAVAVGTSLPEVATTLVAALRGRSALAMGNVVGSNLFNLTAVLGGTATVFPVAVAEGIVATEYVATLALTVLLLPLAITRQRVSRPEGVLLLVAYGLAWVWIVFV